MHIILILVLFTMLSTHCMEEPLAKQVGQDLDLPATKFARHSFSEPTLVGIPEDVIPIILEYAMSANGSCIQAKITPEEEINFTVKGIQPNENNKILNTKFRGLHPCFFVNKKLNRLSLKVQKNLFARLGQKYPKEMREVINTATISWPKNIFLDRFIESIPFLVFALTPRVTPLMVALGYNNEPGVVLLLKAAREKGILKEYVNLDCGLDGSGEAWEAERNWEAERKQKSRFNFKCDENSTALHIACYTDKVPFSILKELLLAEANPNVSNIDERSPLAVLIWEVLYESNVDQVKQKIELLIEYGANPKLDDEKPMKYGSPRMRTACDMLREVVDRYLEDLEQQQMSEEEIEDGKRVEEPLHIQYCRELFQKLNCV